jgi:dienelactone hydrolase
MPAVLVAHGRDRLPEHALRTLIGEAPDEHMTLSFAAHNLPPMPDLGAILVAPWGYGNGSILGLGEEDARAVLADLSRAYAVDDRRVSLTGYSLGGTVSFLYPLHAPGMFSASAPLCGYPNLMDYQSVSRVEQAVWEPALLARKYIVEYAENGQYVPLHVVHGGKDVPGRSKVVVDRYRDLGYSVVFDVPEDADHNVWDDAYEDGKMIPWLTAKRSPKAPQSIRFVTRDYRYDRAYWLRVERMFSSTGAVRAEVDAKWSPKDSRITLETSNVRVLAIDLGALDPKPTADVTIADSGKELTAPPSGVVWIGREAGGAPTLSTTDPCNAADKHHDQSGSLDDLASLPVTVVVGTADAKLVEANRVLADHLARMGGQADVRYPIVDDAAATDDALAGRSVVLVGGPASNTLARALLGAGLAPGEGRTPSVPVRIGASSVTVKDHTEEGDDLGVAFVMPRPEGFHGEAISRRAPSGYVAIYAGLTAEATLSARMLPRYLPDWVVFDSSFAVERGGLLMDARRPRAAGFFSETWE